ncbi:thiamine pyrophosphate-dependent enzyme [Novosphingobium panipatense]|uniref:thiamine pyrophosphate-dependent enzyme n=1 Tax=Novosphingobium panipatense TaxID=428991 RepID=UPI00362122BE
MKTIRAFEERLHDEIKTGEIGGFTHLYAGQEAVAVGICDQLTVEDKIVSTHRGHGHCIAKGCDVKGMMKEIYGRAGGSARAGRDRCISRTWTWACWARTASSGAVPLRPLVPRSPPASTARAGSGLPSPATALATREPRLKR